MVGDSSIRRDRERLPALRAGRALRHRAQASLHISAGTRSVSRDARETHSISNRRVSDHASSTPAAAPAAAAASNIVSEPTPTPPRSRIDLLIASGLVLLVALVFGQTVR